MLALLFSTTTTLTWSAPSEPGGTAPLLYEAIRSSSPSDFTSGTTCVESDGADTTSVDAANPASPRAFFYLVRAQAACGLGTLGKTSGGAERQGRDCP